MDRLRTATAASLAPLLRPVVPALGRRRRSWLLDGLVALLVAPVGLVRFSTATQISCLLLAGLLAARRIWPVPVFLGVSAVCGTAAALGEPMPGLLLTAALVMVHTVAVLCGLRSAITVMVLAEVEVVCITVPIELAPSQKLIAFALFSAPLMVSFTLGLYRSTRDRYLAELQARNRHLEVERVQRDALAAAEERARIGREMHDLIAHHLTVVVALSEGVLRSGDVTAGRSLEVVRTVASTARQALQETRRLLSVFPGSSDAPGTESSEIMHPIPDLRALNGLVSRVCAAGLPVTYEVEGARSEVPRGLQLTVYRLVQEALTNTMKHAHDVTQAVVRLTYRPQEIDIEIRDDGRTGESGAANSSDDLGHGTQGMRERVRSFGGSLVTGPNPAGGWNVRARFPVGENEGGPE
jgi:signal transduction histidine kinase